MQSLLYLAAAVALTLTTAGCSGGSPNGGGSASQSSDTAAGDQGYDPNIKLTGRFLVQGNQLLFSWPGSRISARFTGTQITAKLADVAPTLYQGKSVNNYFDVVIDGGAPATIKMQAGTSEYTLAQGLTQGTHSVTLTKRTEAQTGVSSFNGFVVQGGTLVAPEATVSTRRIEFIGDSITCGYGCEADVTAANMCTFASGSTGKNGSYTFDNTENVDKSYVMLTAKALSADAHVIGFSGKGMVQNLDPKSDPVNTLPVVYPLTNPSNPNILFDDAQFIPDVVVLNAGTNDYYNYNSNPNQVSPPDAATFTAGYLKFLRTLRGRFPKAYIICALGPMLFDAQANTLATQNIKSAIAQAQSGGDSRISFLPFATLTGPNYGCDYHPNASEHQAMATALTQAIKAAVGW